MDYSETLSNAIQPVHNNIVFMSILGALMAFTSLSTDIYLPAMPVMARDLQGDVELTVTGFLIGFAVAQLIWGPISDHLGRRRPLYLGMVLFTVGSVGCALSSSIEQIVIWRIVQAFGACTGPMLARAMIRDLYSRTRAAHMLSTLMMIMAIAPIIGPLLGGQIIKFASWPLIFWLLAAIGILMFLSLHKLPETLNVENRTRSSFLASISNYSTLLRNKEFMRYTLCVAFYYVSAYAFIIGSPFVYIEYYGVDAQFYGWLFAINILGVVGMSYINRKLVQRHALSKLLKIATRLAALTTFILALSVYQDADSLIVIVSTVIIFFSLNGVIAASATAAALDEVKTARIRLGIDRCFAVRQWYCFLSIINPISGWHAVDDGMDYGLVCADQRVNCDQ